MIAHNVNQDMCLIMTSHARKLVTMFKKPLSMVFVNSAKTHAKLVPAVPTSALVALVTI